MSQINTDLIIIGAGPGGYVGAVRAAQLGLKTIVIEEDKVGGVCLNRGCIPSKSLIHQAGEFMSIPALSHMGISVDTSGFDYSKVQAASRKAADALSGGVEFLLKKNKVQVIKGHAVLSGKGKVTVNDTQVVQGKNILLATGSRPRALPGLDFDSETVLSSDDILNLTRLPKRVVIIGGGAIGCEFAYVMNGFGVEVTIVELLDSLLPKSDRETVTVLERAFKKRKIKLLTGSKIVNTKKTDQGIDCTVETKGKKQTLQTDLIFSVTGRTPNTESLGLEQTKIQTDRGYILVSDYYQTAEPGVYAVGDIIPSLQLAHASSAQAKLVVEHIAGHPTAKSIPVEKIPTAVYTEPQVAGFGLTEEEAKEQKREIKKLVFPYRGAGKSVAVEASEGQVKILVDKQSEEILGAHIIGAQATELIHEILLAAGTELLPEDILATVHAHPTLSEIIPEVFEQAGGQSIHI